jgi:predicted nucleotidyltransferase
VNLDLTALAELARAELPNALFVTVSGSHLYGFSSADSDIDLRGCYLALLESRLGLRPGPETVERTPDLNGTEVELVAHEAGKYLGLMTRHNGYILEQVFSPMVVLGGDFLARIRPLARRCVTRGCYHHYRGFFQSRRKLLEKEPVKRAKSLLYAYRVALTGIHLLRTGEVEANLPALNHGFALPFIDDLIARKAAKERGELSDLDWEFHAAELDRLEQQLTEAHVESPLPEEPAVAELNRFLIGLRMAAGGG